MRVLFVCTGNICRSPAAHAILESAARRDGLVVTVDSAGIGGWHAGELPDGRARAEGARRGYTLDHPARRVTAADFYTFDLIVAMDTGHHAALERVRPRDATVPVVLYRSFEPAAPDPDVADPYYDGTFSEMFDVLERGLPGLLRHLGG